MNSNTLVACAPPARLDDYKQDLTEKGWTVVPSLIDTAILDAANVALASSLALRDDIRCRNGVSENTEGTVHHLLMDAGCYVELLSELRRLDYLLKDFFEGNYILNAYGGVVNSADTRAYVQSVHRDIRFWSPNKRFMLNVLVMLDKFTVENGATHLLSNSHHASDKPSDEVFFGQSSRALGARGSVLLFDSRTWHATGINRTRYPRRALTLSFTCPFLKQQLDYPRLFGYDNVSKCDDWLRQVIGFNARVPESLEQFYLPVAERFYQRGQD